MTKARIETGLVICIAITFPWHSQVQLAFGSVNLSLSDPFLIMVGILILFGRLKLGELPSFSNQIFGFLIVVLISTIIAIFRYPELTDPISGISEIIKMLASITYFFAVIILFLENTEEKIYIFSLATALVSILFFVWSTAENIMGFHRPSGPFDNPNLYADYLLFSFFILWYLVSDDKTHQKYKGFIVLLILLLIISLLGTESRSALVSLFVGISAIFVIKYRIYLNRVLTKPGSLLFPVTVIISIIIVFLSFDWRVVDRFERLSSDSGDTGGRFDRWLQAIGILFDSSLLGVGWGQHPQHIVESNRFIHNSLIQATVDSGIIGGLLLVALFVFVVRRGVELFLIKGNSFSLYITAFIISAIANSMFHNNLNFRSFWIALGFVGVLELYYRQLTNNYHKT